jgi:hypothetical protein
MEAKADLPADGRECTARSDRRPIPSEEGSLRFRLCADTGPPRYTDRHNTVLAAALAPTVAPRLAPNGLACCAPLAEVDPATFVPTTLRVRSATRHLTRWPES